jgi:CRP-like cAMP-binding protein
MNNYYFKNEYLLENATLAINNGDVLQKTVDTIKRWAVDNHFQKAVDTSLIKKLFANQLLALLPDNVFAKLSPHFERVLFSCEEKIYQPGDLINFIYFPESAVMSEYQILEDGRTIEIAMTGKEGVVGFSSMLNSNPATNWTQISVAGSALKINTQAIKREFTYADRFQELLFDYINKYINQISQRVICNSYHMTEARFCSWLLMLHNRNNCNNKLRLTQEQIARYLGVHRPSVTQIALSLRKKKIINYMRGEISIINRREMENSACSCYGIIDNTFLTQSLF